MALVEGNDSEKEKEARKCQVIMGLYGKNIRIRTEKGQLKRFFRRDAPAQHITVWW